MKMDSTVSMNPDDPIDSCGMQRRAKTHSTFCHDVAVTSTTLSLQGVVSNVIAYLPWKQQFLTCRLVSKVWCAAVDEDRTEPITLHVEDRDPCQTWRFPEKYHLKGKEFKDSSFPLWRVSVMPDMVASRVTKMILVARFSPLHQHCYDLADYHSLDGTRNVFWRRFMCLEDLTILSDFNMACALFMRAGYHLNWFRYEDFFVGCDRFPLSLKRLVYYETCTSGQESPCGLAVEGTGCDVGLLVYAAPNLEVLECPGNEVLFGNFSDLLPVSKTLRRLNLGNCKNMTNDMESIEAVSSHFPNLEAWDISGAIIADNSSQFQYHTDLLTESFETQIVQKGTNGTDWDYAKRHTCHFRTFWTVFLRFIQALREKNSPPAARNVTVGNTHLWVRDPTTQWNTQEKWKEHVEECKDKVQWIIDAQKFMRVGDRSCVTFEHYRREMLRYEMLWDKHNFFLNPWLTINIPEVSWLATQLRFRRNKKKMKASFARMATSLGLNKLSTTAKHIGLLPSCAPSDTKTKNRSVYAPLELKVEKHLVFGCPWHNQPLVKVAERWIYRRPLRKRYLVAKFPTAVLS
jgi:hypothetical protein